MPEAKRFPRPKRKKSEVDVQAGWRYLFFSVALAGILGLSFRIYFSPAHVKALVNAVLEEHPLQVGFHFQGASLQLAQGARPHLAIVLTGVEIAPAPECRAEPSLTISELRLPFRVRSLLSGHVVLGTVRAESMSVDLDGLKERCTEGSRSHASAGGASAVVPAKARAVAQVTKGNPWWVPEQLRSIRRLVEGAEISRVELAFEKQTKKVFLETLRVSADPDGTTMHLSTGVRLSPEMVYNERLPAFAINLVAHPDTAEAHLRAGFDEGELLAHATLTPAADRGLWIDLQANARDVALSTLAPFFAKAGLASSKLSPKFVWLTCGAHIQGEFQGLFKNNPLTVENCAIEGQGARLALKSTVRQADGRWDPFQIEMSQVDVRRVLEMFHESGPDGVAADFGRLSGQLRVQSHHEAIFEGELERASIRFSNRSLRSPQKIERLATRIALVPGTKNGPDVFEGKITDVDLDPGDFTGEFKFVVARDLKSGTIDASIQSLKLDPRVQVLMTGGDLGETSGQAHASFRDGHITAFKSDFTVASLESAVVRLSHGHVAAERLETGRYQISVQAPEMEISRESFVGRSVRPIFFAHDFESDWLKIQSPIVHAQTSSQGDWSWDKTSGQLEEGRIRVASLGRLDVNHDLSGSVTVDYPQVKKLKWALAGNLSGPELRDDSPSLNDLRRRTIIDDQILGLPSPAGAAVKLENSEGPDDASMAVRTTRGLRELGARVIDRARSIVPKAEDDAAQVNAREPAKNPAKKTGIK